MSNHDAEVERLQADLAWERQAREGLAATLKAVMEDRDREQRQHGSWFRRAAIAEGKVGLHQGRAEAAEAALGKERQAREWAEQQVKDIVERMDQQAIDEGKRIDEVNDLYVAAERERDNWQEEARLFCQNADYWRERTEAAEQARREAEAALAGARGYLSQLCHHCDESKPTSECIACQARGWLESNDAGKALLAQVDAGKRLLEAALLAEWGNLDCNGEQDPMIQAYCPVCAAHQYVGHEPGCELADALARWREVSE